MDGASDFGRHAWPVRASRLTRRRLVGMFGVAAGATLLAACSQPATTAAPTSAPPAKPTVPASAASPSAGASPGASGAAAPASGAAVKVGVLTPLSPPGDAGAGQLIIRGAELAVDYANARIGPGWSAASPLPGPIDLVKGDDAGTPEKGLAAFRKMAQDDKVAVVVGQFHSSVTVALCPVADQLKVPMMSSQSSATDITGKHFQFVFQTHAITDDRAAAVSDFVKGNTASFPRIAIVAESTDYGTGNTDALKALLQAVSGVEVKDWTFDNKTTDLSPLLLQVKQFGPDLLYNLGVGAPAYLVLKQAWETGILPKAVHLLSYDLPLRPEFWQNVGDQGKGLVFVSYYHPQQALTEAGKWLQTEYQKRYGEAPVYSTFQGFGNTVMMAQAINQASSTDGTAIVKALETGKMSNWNADGVSFPRSEGVDWHRVKIPILLVQYTETSQKFASATILSPQSMKTGDLKHA